MKILKNVLVVAMSFISVLAIFINLDISNLENTTETSYLIRCLIDLNMAIPRLDISHFFIFIFISYFYKKNYFKNKKTKKSIAFLSIIFSLSLLFGYSFYKTNSWDLITNGEIQIFKSLIKLFGYYFMIYILINKLFETLKYLSEKNKVEENKILNFVFEKHSYIKISIILILIWLPCIVLFYPGIITSDGGNQIVQLLGEYQSVHVNLINPNVTLNNHHPILLTLIIGAFIKLGYLIGRVDIGIYIYILFQTGILIYVILYSFKIMEKMNTSNIYKLMALIFYAFCPLFYIYTLNFIKDICFSICIFYYILLLIEILLDNDVLIKYTYLIKLVIVLLLIMLFRNNGIYTILLSLPFLCISVKMYKKRLIICLLIPILIYLGLNKILYPIIGVSPGSVKEALSIPFQQTARTLYEGKQYEKMDLEKISEVLDVEVISKKYNPILSDPVKNTFNKDCNTKMLINYFKVWFKYLFIYPGTYIEATLNNSYAYLYPDKINSVGYFESEKWFVERNPLNMEDLQLLQNQRNVLKEYYKIYLKLPVIGTLLSAGFYSWLLVALTVYTILSNEKKYVIIYLALISILLVCIASPYFAIRYMLSIVYCMPILIILNIYLSKKEKTHNTKDLP